MTELTGTGQEIALDDGTTRIGAPGLLGRATTGHVDLATPTATLLHQSLANSGLTPTTHVLLTHRTSADADVQLTVPPPGEGRNAVLLVHDADGAASWHLPVDPTAAARDFTSPAAGAGESAAAAAAPRELAFRIPKSRFATPRTGFLERAEHDVEEAVAGIARHFDFHPGLAGVHKVLSVLDYPIDHLVGNTVSELFHRWEVNKHPYVLRWFPAAENLTTGEPLTPTNWHELGQGRALLLIHGIFSTCSGAFGSIDHATWAQLRARYGNRIFGFDHPTASITPDANATWFLEQVPDRVTLDLDILCHSRGGLVARSLAKQAAEGRPAQSESAPTTLGPVTVSNIVFAATPNGGSEITDTAKWSALINRVTSLLTLPARVIPAPIEAITGVLAGVLEVVKLVAVNTALALPGLEAMLSGSDFLNGLAQVSATPTYFAVAADFTPGSVLNTLFDGRDDDGRVIDAAIFPNTHNDIAVPTKGVSDPANPAGLDPPPPVPRIPGFPVVPDANRLEIGPGDKIWHSTYFTDPDVCAALLRWLNPPEPTGSAAAWIANLHRW